RPRPDDLEI
nr:Chain C, peptide from Gap junction alpha-1 protein [synthetic construct]3CYY_D Chain D, peptide from Gap junction alpha-1 protein [synthetic construct]